MKKLLKVSAFAMVLLMLVAAFASCAGPADDADDARRALIKNDYEVTLIEDDDNGVLANMEKQFDLFGLEEYILAYDNEDMTQAKNFIAIFYFDETRDAKDSMKGIEELVKELETDLKEDGIDVDALEFELDRSGDVVWWGTPDAIKAAK